MTDSKDNYYEILGVSKNATDKTIRTAYRKLAIAYHPDKNPSKEAHERFVEINEAYSVLSDPEKRKIYDIYGKQGLYGEPRMDLQKALEQFWLFFRPSGYERSDQASATHGVYVATVGGITAPLKGVALGVGAAGIGIAGGAIYAGGGIAGGAIDLQQGVSNFIRRKEPQENEPTPAQYIVRGIAKPVVGVVAGTVIGTAGAVAGVGAGVVGGIGGAYMNLRDGGNEIYERSLVSSTYAQSRNEISSISMQQREKLLIKDISQSGKELWNSAFDN